MDVSITRAVVRFPVEGRISDGPIVPVGNSETLTMRAENFQLHLFVMDGRWTCSEVTVLGPMGAAIGWQKPAQHTYLLHLPGVPQWVLDLVELVTPFQSAPLFSPDIFKLDGDA
jgi:hypothetical protein